MKTIAISIDEVALRALDDLVRGSRARTRSLLVREAVREFIEREHRRQAEARDGAILGRHRRRLARQTRALIAAQARP